MNFTRFSTISASLVAILFASACSKSDDDALLDARVIADSAIIDAAPDGPKDAGSTADAQAPTEYDASDVDDASEVDAASIVDAAPATGESCTSAIPLASGTAVYGFSATRLDHLSADLLHGAGCISAHVLTGPDIVFAYKATSTGTLTITVSAKSDYAGGKFRVAAVLTDDPCASPVLDQAGGCASAYSDAPKVTVTVSAVAGTTYYLHVAKTDSSPNTFASGEVEITVAEG
ncbi:MAG: hypothetical protein HY698_00220 [Deltaproteobacteria bacterium]|nr:hypothetical protein [Deltaproteobacteria bacterium]